MGQWYGLNEDGYAIEKIGWCVFRNFLTFNPDEALLIAIIRVRCTFANELLAYKGQFVFD